MICGQLLSSPSIRLSKVIIDLSFLFLHNHFHEGRRGIFFSVPLFVVSSLIDGTIGDRRSLDSSSSILEIAIAASAHS